MLSPWVIGVKVCDYPRNLFKTPMVPGTAPAGG
jgi:hypothetical protein